MDNRAIKKQVLELLAAKGYKDQSAEDIAKSLGLGHTELAGFEGLLQNFAGEGLLHITKKGLVQGAKEAGLMTGTMRNLTKTGGFASLADGSGDVFIAKRHLKGAMPTDIVAMEPVKKSDGLPEARVKKVLQRNFNEFTGTYSVVGGTAFVTADAYIRSPIPVEGPVEGIADGDKVLARFEDGSALIIKGFGPATSAAACCGAVLSRFHVRRDFPPEVLEEARQKAALPESLEGRLDLRELPIFTIDGATSKDLDDAVSVERLETGWRLGVHIADVSHFVTPGSALDAETLRRGTSIYYADSVIPMLPKELSNGICSLNPNEDRLAFSALLEMDEAGAMTGWRFGKSVIRSRVKGVYEEINRIFAGTADDAILQKYAEVTPALSLMRVLAKRLTARRGVRGALDIDSADCKITVGPDGVVQDVERREQGEAELMIEEFMLSANEAVASFAVERGMPLLFRVHDAPEPKKLDELKKVLDAAGIGTKGLNRDVTPQDFARLMGRLRETGKAAVFEGLVLRAMAKARYSPDCTGHFGLALERYCHFTSPIRRYPDLATHRILAEILAGATKEQMMKRYRAFTESAAEQSSECEINAMQVERTCDSIYKAEYMRVRLGEIFPAFVSSVKAFGIYVQLENTVEGLCRTEDLPGGPYDYDEARLCLTDHATGKSFALGDTLRVQVVRADTATGQIDFVLEGTQPGKGRMRSAKSEPHDGGRGTHSKSHGGAKDHPHGKGRGKRGDRGGRPHPQKLKTGRPPRGKKRSDSPGK